MNGTIACTCDSNSALLTFQLPVIGRVISKTWTLDVGILSIYRVQAELCGVEGMRPPS